MAEALGTFYLPEICRKFCQIIQKTGFNEIHLHLWRHNKHITKDSVKILFNWKYSAFQHMLLSNLNNIIARKKKSDFNGQNWVVLCRQNTRPAYKSLIRVSMMSLLILS